MALVTVLENEWLFEKLGNTQQFRDCGEIYSFLSSYMEWEDCLAYSPDEGGVYIFQTETPEEFCTSLENLVEKHKIVGHFTVAVSDSIRKI